jgi:hypothetical protein
MSARKATTGLPLPIVATIPVLATGYLHHLGGVYSAVKPESFLYSLCAAQNCFSHILLVSLPAVGQGWIGTMRSPVYTTSYS